MIIEVSRVAKKSIQAYDILNLSLSAVQQYMIKIIIKE